MELNALLAQPITLPSLPRAVALLMNELSAVVPNLRRLNLDTLGQAVPGTLAGVHAFARDPTPLYDLVPAQWRERR